MLPLEFSGPAGLLLCCATFGQAAGQPDKMAQADALLASPALDYQKAPTSPGPLRKPAPGQRLALLTRLARACFILGDLAPIKERGPLL